MKPLELMRCVQTGLMHHAYILYGEDVKTAEETALKIANFFEHGALRSPEKLLVESFLVRPIDRSLGINEARSIRNFLVKKPVFSEYKTVIVAGAELMTQEAQNALLKIMEEPPQYACIFLVALQKERILPTVQSRAHAVHFPLERISKNKFDIASLKKLISKDVDGEEKIDEALSSLLDELRSEPVKNLFALKETVKRITAIKQLSTNKRLQIRAIYNAVAYNSKSKTISK